MELRRKEDEVEREKAHAKKLATRDMLTQSITLAKRKRDQDRHEEMVCDMKLLEENIKGLADQSLAIQQRKVTYTYIHLLRTRCSFISYLISLHLREREKRRNACISCFCHSHVRTVTLHLAIYEKANTL